MAINNERMLMNVHTGSVASESERLKVVELDNDLIARRDTFWIWFWRENENEVYETLERGFIDAYSKEEAEKLFMEEYKIYNPKVYHIELCNIPPSYLDSPPHL